MTAAKIARRIEARRTGPDRYKGNCPAHSDRHRSLSITQGANGVLLKCSQGCSVKLICAAMGIKVIDLFDCEQLKLFDGVANDRR